MCVYLILFPTPYPLQSFRWIVTVFAIQLYCPEDDITLRWIMLLYIPGPREEMRGAEREVGNVEGSECYNQLSCGIELTARIISACPNCRVTHHAPPPPNVY
jgi:hypothetical protein